ncbi:hypothetical protein RA269_27880, partial [Pseudomonas syringae pv. tagetis]
GLYTLAGTLGLICVIGSGAKWLIARSPGDRSQPFMDYMAQVVVVVGVGVLLVFGVLLGVVVFVCWLWGLWLLWWWVFWCCLCVGWGCVVGGVVWCCCGWVWLGCAGVLWSMSVSGDSFFF